MASKTDTKPKTPKPAKAAAKTEQPAETVADAPTVAEPTPLSDEERIELLDLRKKTDGDAANVASLRAQLKAEQEKVRAAIDTIKTMEADSAEVRLTVGSLKHLSTDAVDAMIKADHTTKFQVTADYRLGAMKMVRGRVLEARHYPQLLTHVSNGLKLIKSC